MRVRKSTSSICPSAGRFTVTILFLSLAAFIFPTVTSASWADRWFYGDGQMPLIVAPPSPISEPQRPSQPSSPKHEFALRHIFDHGLYEYQALHRRLDIRPGNPVLVTSTGGEPVNLGMLPARSIKTRIERLSDRRVSTAQSLYHSARLTGQAATLDASAWVQDDVSAPNTTDKETVLSLARMSWDAYTAEPGTGEWQDATGKFNNSQGFGWEGDSLRGHIFADQNNATVIIALKGTSPGMCDSSGFLLVFLAITCFTCERFIKTPIVTMRC